MKNVILKGTFLLTAAGVLSRFMGFFYRIFLANTIGAEGMGIYQLIFPVYAICFSLCSSGIETAISKLTSEKYAQNHSEQSSCILNAGISITLILSILCSVVIYQNADFISLIFFKEARCVSLLKILAITIPFGTIQSCFCGYYFGRHNAMVPAAAQIVEQTTRIGSVILLYHIFLRNNLLISPAIAVIGLVFGEFCSLLFTITCYSFHSRPLIFDHSVQFCHYKEILSLSLPLTASRICTNVLASLEAALIPNALKAYGLDSSAALSIYGVLNGMALPFILFPNALTGSISLMLLPSISESHANRDFSSVRRKIKLSSVFCICLGIFCLLFFLIFGTTLGEFIFSSTLAGSFITILAWMCPFLYLNTTLTSSLNGLGKTSITFFNGITGLFIRIIFIFLLVPKIGIHGYLYGLLCSQLFLTFSSAASLHYVLRKL